MKPKRRLRATFVAMITVAGIQHELQGAAPLNTPSSTLKNHHAEREQNTFTTWPIGVLSPSELGRSYSEGLTSGWLGFILPIANCMFLPCSTTETRPRRRRWRFCSK